MDQSTFCSADAVLNSKNSERDTAPGRVTYRFGDDLRAFFRGACFMLVVMSHPLEQKTGMVSGKR
jgi:hypothetical protein